MAEGLLRHLASDRFEVMSAGTEATHVRPLSVSAMDELGIDISDQESKKLSEKPHERANRLTIKRVIATYMNASPVWGTLS